MLIRHKRALSPPSLLLPFQCDLHIVSSALAPPHSICGKSTRVALSMASAWCDMLESRASGLLHDFNDSHCTEWLKGYAGWGQNQTYVWWVTYKVHLLLKSREWILEHGFWVLSVWKPYTYIYSFMYEHLPEQNPSEVMFEHRQDIIYTQIGFGWTLKR